MKKPFLRRLMMATALAGGFLLGNDDAFAQEKEHKPPSQRKFTKAVRLSDTLDSTKRATINLKLYSQAQAKAEELATAASTAYSARLDSLEKDFDEKLAANPNSLHDHAIFLDPVKADVLTALGYDDLKVARYMLELHGLKDMPFGQPLKTLAKYFSDLEKTVPTQDPAAFINYLGLAPKAVLMVPLASSIKEDRLRIDGLTHEENIDFINLHEGWHAFCDRFTMADIDTLETKKADFTNNRSIAENEHAVKQHTRKMKREMIADVGALGDMIRCGKSTDIIGHVITWRESPPEFTHLTTKALVALKEHIDSVGIENFRKIDHAAALALYHGIADEAALTPSGFKAITLYLPSTSDSIRTVWKNSPETAAEFKKTLHYYDYFNELAKKTHKIALPSVDRQKAVWKLQDEKWNPLQEMKDAAFKAEGRITPETLTRAYLRILSGYEKQIPAAGRESGLLVERMEDLQIAYVTQLSKIDYVTANAAYGIKPKKTEKFAR